MSRLPPLLGKGQRARGRQKGPPERRGEFPGRQTGPQPRGGESGHPGGESAKALLPGVLRRAGQGSELGGNGETPSLEPGAGEAAASPLLRDSPISSPRGSKAVPAVGASGAVSRVLGERAAGLGGWREGAARVVLPGSSTGINLGEELLCEQKKKKETAEQRGYLRRGWGLLALLLHEVKNHQSPRAALQTFARVLSTSSQLNAEEGLLPSKQNREILKMKPFFHLG